MSDDVVYMAVSVDGEIVDVDCITISSWQTIVYRSIDGWEEITKEEFEAFLHKYPQKKGPGYVHS